jgi:hypothetical protein
LLRFALFLALLALPAWAEEEAPTAFAPGGANVVRWARGEIAYQKAGTGETFGAEAWDMTVHPDGSRSLRATDTLANGMTHTVHLRVEADFRPRELFTEYWLNGAFRSATFIAVRGILLDITTRFAETTNHGIEKIPQAFSFNTQTSAGNVWHGWYYDKAHGGAQKATIYAMDTSAQQPYQTGAVRTQSIVYVGNELVSVPAGAFPCDHYRIDDTVDYYVTGPDAIFVKEVTPTMSFVLTKLETGER